MIVQPKLLTVFIASQDFAKNYATIRSLQQMHYRNHEIVCVVPAHHRQTAAQLRRDFNWMPIITKIGASVSTLLKDVIERGQYSHVDAFVFVESGTTAAQDFLHKLIEQIHLHPSANIIIPTITRPEGKVIFGGKQYGKWPYQVSSVVLEEKLDEIKTPYFLGGACLIQAKTVYKNPITESSDDLALLYWTSAMIQSDVRSHVALDLTANFDGVLYSDFLEGIGAPSSWFSDMRRYLNANGKWYDKLSFWAQCRWRHEGTIVSKMLHTFLQQNVAHKLPQ